MSNSFLDRLRDAHAKIEERLKDLERAAAGSDLATMKDVLAFFETFVREHQDEEEKILFPKLAHMPAFTQMLGAFDFQHRMNEAEETAFAARVRDFTPGGESALRQSAHRFIEVQRAHVLAEERALFPEVEKTLTADELREMLRIS